MARFSQNIFVLLHSAPPINQMLNFIQCIRKRAKARTHEFRTENYINRFKHSLCVKNYELEEAKL
jgi:hypothetical protein